MPKNTAGGKKYKKLKHNMEMSRPLELPEENQEFALVNKLMGNGRATVTYIENNQHTRNALGIISGKLRKRKQWVIAGNIVMISTRDFETEKVDIIHVYKEYEMNELKRRGLLPKELIKHSNNHGGPLHSSNVDDEEFAEFVDEEKEYKEKKPLIKNSIRGNNISVQNFDYLDNTDGSEESEIEDRYEEEISYSTKNEEVDIDNL